jgi:hypothetical protein
MLASASLREDATLLDLLVEAPQGTLEGLVFPYAYFSQSEITSRRPICARNDCSIAGKEADAARLRLTASRAKGGRSVAGEACGAT